MVHKKIPQKTISLQQPDHVFVKVKPKNLSQPKQQQQDVNKNTKGPDLKKMKKSGSMIKRQELGKPNYMKPTSSSDARKGLQVMSFKPIISSSVIRRKKVAFLQKNIDSQRSTCSSTLKDTKFPAYLSLNPGATESQGTSVMKVCPYTYCSLNGHHHAPLPPLKCFLSARRRAIKSQRRTVNPVVTGDDFSVEIYRDDKDEDVDDQVENVQFDEQASDMEWETQGTDVKSDIDGGDELIDDNEFVKIEADKKENECVDEFFPSDQESFDDEERFNSDWFSISDDDGDSTNYLAPNDLPGEENQENPAVADQLKKAKTETEDSGQLVLAITKRNKPIDEDTDDSGTFNPRAPNFLSLEPDPDAEKVDLKHQDLDERKNSEEWMVDFALRQVVTKLGSARKRKVALLVEAFEKVTPVKKYEVQLRDASMFDQARPMQACS